jgi:hypothetical protein
MTLPMPDLIRFVYPATIMTDGRPQVNPIA